MRNRIRAHKGLTGPLRVPGHDVKLGQGGIREIEFFTQTRQLIVGGRDPELRQRETLAALDALAGKGWVERETARTLSQAYVAHRDLEHRLQMLEDAQTQRLPDSPEGIARLAAFSAAPSPEAFEREIEDRLDHRPRDSPTRSSSRTRRAATRRRPRPCSPTPRQRTRSSRDGSACRRSAANAPAPSSPRLEPELMHRIAEAASPDAALTSLDAFLSRLPAGVQIFSMMEANPSLIDLLIDICGTAPQLARHLGSDASVLEAVVSRDFYRPLRGAADARSRARPAPARRGGLRDGAEPGPDLDEGAPLPHRACTSCAASPSPRRPPLPIPPWRKPC